MEDIKTSFNIKYFLFVIYYLEFINKTIHLINIPTEIDIKKKNKQYLLMFKTI